jgi:hypothetical protein
VFGKIQNIQSFTGVGADMAAKLKRWRNVGNRFGVPPAFGKRTARAIGGIHARL